jgi:hypothetical protein
MLKERMTDRSKETASSARVIVAGWPGDYKRAIEEYVTTLSRYRMIPNNEVVQKKGRVNLDKLASQVKKVPGPEICLRIRTPRRTWFGVSSETKIPKSIDLEDASRTVKLAILLEAAARYRSIGGRKSFSKARKLEKEALRIIGGGKPLKARIRSTIPLFALAAAACTAKVEPKEPTATFSQPQVTEVVGLPEEPSQKPTELVTPVPTEETPEPAPTVVVGAFEYNFKPEKPGYIPAELPSAGGVEKIIFNKAKSAGGEINTGQMKKEGYVPLAVEGGILSAEIKNLIFLPYPSKILYENSQGMLEELDYSLEHSGQGFAAYVDKEGNVRRKMLIILPLVDESVLLFSRGYEIDNSQSENWYGSDEEPIVLKTPFEVKVKVGYEGPETGDGVSVSISGRINQTGKEWWEGINRLYIWSRPNGKIELEFHDGRGAASAIWMGLAGVRAGDELTFRFHDPQGKKLSIYDAEGNLLKDIDVTKLSGVYLPQGLFPDKLFYPGVLLAPKTKAQIGEFYFAPLVDKEYHVTAVSFNKEDKGVVYILSLDSEGRILSKTPAVFDGNTDIRIKEDEILKLYINGQRLVLEKGEFGQPERQIGDPFLPQGISSFVKSKDGTLLGLDEWGNEIAYFDSEAFEWKASFVPILLKENGIVMQWRNGGWEQIKIPSEMQPALDRLKIIDNLVQVETDTGEVVSVSPEDISISYNPETKQLELKKRGYMMFAYKKETQAWKQYLYEFKPEKLLVDNKGQPLWGIEKGSLAKELRHDNGTSYRFRIFGVVMSEPFIDEDKYPHVFIMLPFDQAKSGLYFRIEVKLPKDEIQYSYPGYEFVRWPWFPFGGGKYITVDPGNIDDLKKFIKQGYPLTVDVRYLYDPLKLLKESPGSLRYVQKYARSIGENCNSPESCEPYVIPSLVDLDLYHKDEILAIYDAFYKGICPQIDLYVYCTDFGVGVPQDFSDFYNP